MKKAIQLVLLLWVGLTSTALLSQASGTQPGSGSAAPKNNNVGAKAPDEVQSANVGSDYIIGADDTLHISVWKEPDLTETLPVRPDGKISMPLLNDVTAAGLTPLQLRDTITERLKKYIADPRVTVVVTGMNSRRVFVTGEVTHTGPMTLLPHMTVLQALAQAGFTQFANPKAIYLLRTENGRQQKIPFNYKEVVKGNHPEQNIQLKPGDTIVVP
jgi:polysaccharide biosynthesis/export protein